MGLTEEEFISDLQRSLSDCSHQNPLVNSAAAGLNLILQSLSTQQKHREMPRSIKGEYNFLSSYLMSSIFPEQIKNTITFLLLITPYLNQSLLF